MGHRDLRSRPGRGTTVKLTVPVPAHQPQPAQSGGGATAADRYTGPPASSAAVASTADATETAGTG